MRLKMRLPALLLSAVLVIAVFSGILLSAPEAASMVEGSQARMSIPPIKPFGEEKVARMSIPPIKPFSDGSSASA
ncbi:MAG TPA: hypothetical protein GXX57_04680 [Firmicutes bacterium]|nr:hypothetical protein [Bacillota bacterium]